ncbi:hypothetical protein AVMA1855_20170 [Acidovorax sp. SUPP1855]|uniref:hypothetical protein n=1 Tax=Acidovorax sp. SUPP1855 TaxID=431774 RepID=UPI0023DE21FA|nr:hypothetical protein [Acidovorax sp. SUPP1855]GKS86508.1 hypothetical protein AVMA1855_20170 [Acidovorax sp. SUPP1855]
MYQFIHIETYARSASKKTKPSKPKGGAKKGAKAKPAAAVSDAVVPKGMDVFTQADGSKGKKGKSTMAEVLAEALRDDGHCAHVAQPEPPTFLVGDEAVLRGLPAEIERNCVAYSQRTGGPAVRKDAHVLLAGVASYPRALSDADPAGYDCWEKATVRWLREKYGENLRCVLRHGNDEAHPHIHFFVCDRTRVNAKELHDGYAAVAHLPLLSKENKQVFNDAMRDFQSDYYAKVGHAAGLLRDGPKRKRMDRPTYKAIQREARERVALNAEVSQVHADLLNGAAIEAKKAAEQRREVEREAGALAVERAELDKLRDRTQSDRAAVDEEWARARDARAAAEQSENAARRLEQSAKRERASLDKQAERLAQATAARDQEADALRAEKARAVAISRRYEGRLAGLGAVEDVRALVGRPELVAMLEFIDKTLEARELLDFMKSDPEMFRVMAASIDVYRGIGNSAQAPWQSDLSRAAAAYLESEREREREAQAQPQAKGSGLDFGM